LSKAAVALAAGEPDILDLALSLGYGSHEAFSRAFKNHFDLTPDNVRKQGHTNNLILTEVPLMNSTNMTELPAPRFEDLGQLSIVGISRRYSFEEVGEIPAQWQNFGPLIPRLAADADTIAYGVIYHPTDESFDYLTGVQVGQGRDVPPDLARLDIHPRCYAVFAHTEHVSSVRATCDAIWSEWLPGSGRTAVEAPWFERYGVNFDPQTGEGGLEIWIPVTS
jgi:AraC family transcriptional regulator